MPGLSADSLEDVSREAEATPGLQQLARVFTIQLQVLNGADDLCMHVSNHTEHTHTQCGEENRGGVWGSGEGRGKKRQKEEGKGKKKKNVKGGVVEHHCLDTLEENTPPQLPKTKNTHCRMAGGLISRGTSCSAHP